VGARLRSEDLDALTDVPGVGTMRIDDYVATRVLGVAAHGLDVAITLDRTPWTTEPALRICKQILEDLLGPPPPPTLGWDDLELLAKGTGRYPLDSKDLAVLGPAAEEFPLLS
jgi:hypothetical protein